MAATWVLLFAAGVIAVSAIPTLDPVLFKLDDGPRYQHLEDSNGGVQLADTWMTAKDMEDVARFDPDRQIVYHLYTRNNPSVSQPLLVGSTGLLGLTNYNPQRRTIILLHGWRVNYEAVLNLLLVPAFLRAEDVNVIVVDWSAGANFINYATAVANTVTGGQGIARFINWLNDVTGAVPTHYHIVGHSLGAHQAGIIGRNINGKIAYITALEAALLGFINNEHTFRADDAAYTEAIHTNAGNLGYMTPIAHVDFYPNGGINMPGCGGSVECDHARSYYYFEESLITGRFVGTRCASYLTAMSANCVLPGRLTMGGLVPKTGTTGIYYLETNAAPPFARG